MLKRKLIFKIDWFIPVELASEAKADDPKTVRTRILISFILSMIIAAVIFMCVYFWLGSAGASLSALLGIPTVGLFLIVIKKTGATTFISNCFVILMVIVFFSISYFTNGFNAPVIGWYILLPFIAFYTAGSRSGFVWCFIVVLVYLVYFILYKIGFTFRQDLDSSDIYTLRFLAMAFLIPLIFLFLKILEASNQRSIKLIKLRDTELRESEERYRFLVTGIADVIWTRDLDFNLTYMSPAIERIRGYSPEEVKSQKLEQIMPKESLEKISNLWRKEILRPKSEENKTFNIEVEVYHKNGSRIWIEVTSRPINDETGQPVGIIGVTRDITRRKEAESKLEAAQKELVANAHRAGMADIAADTLHNVGNLMNSIKTSAHIIQQTSQHSSLSEFKKANSLLRENQDTLGDFLTKDPMGNKLLQYYFALEKKLDDENNLVLENIDRLNRKIETISNVISSQQAYAGLNLWIEDCSLPELIEDVLMIQSELLKNSNIKVVKQFQPIPKVSVQKTKLLHILINLVQNSLDAMAETPVDERLIKLSLGVKENRVLLIFEDSGKGIEKGDLIKIFTHGYTTRKDGHGFGLHSCANYASEMDGKIWAESDGKGNGARFYLELPVASATSETITPQDQI